MDGGRVYYRDPNGRSYLLVDQTTTPKADPLKDWQANEPGTRARLAGYRRVRMERVDYLGYDTADWEFTWRASGGRLHVLNRNVRVSDRRAYALYWSVPDGEWAQRRATFDTIASTFRPAR